MGLEDFNSDANDNQSSGSSDTSNSRNSNDKSSNEQRNGNEESQGGLESFRTTPSRGGSGGNNKQANSDDTVLGINPREWNKMTVKQRINEVRKRKIPDFRPDIQLDDRWGWAKAVKVECVCGNQMYFTAKTKCSNCGREYKMKNRTVIKTADPNNEVIHNNER